jgi:RNA polymerase sigma factor (sigma-70 family)
MRTRSGQQERAGTSSAPSLDHARGLDRAAQQRLLERAASALPEERRAALEELLADCRGPALAAVHRVLAACNADHGLAEEALQEATLKLLAGGLQAFRGQAAPRTYFVRIAINAALDAVRRRVRRRELGDLADRLSAGPSAEEQLADAQLRDALLRCLEELPPRYRQSVALYYLDEIGDCATCARCAGVSREAFMQQISRARQRLADCLRRRLR